MKMWKIIVFCVSLVTIVNSETNTPSYISYNSSDLSYLSNGIQFPAPGATEVPLLQSPENISDIEWFSKLYGHHGWEDRLSHLSDLKCQKDMHMYLEALKNDTSWASKIYDASGRYAGQFFFGNDFWLGSSTLCWDLGNNVTNGEVPPFDVTFYVAKIRININDNMTPVTRQLNIGQCLPKSCKTSDVRTLLIKERSRATSLSVIDVRPVPGEYSVFGDVKFYVVSGLGTFIFILIVIATILELWQRQKPSVNNNNNNLEDGKGKSKAPEKIKSMVVRLLLCFGFAKNSKKILSVDRVTDDAIKCIHGLRFFSIAWIIMVHTYLEVFAIAENKTLRSVIERSFLYQTVSNATFSVDTFFFISGLLVTIVYFRSAKRKSEGPEKRNRKLHEDISHFFTLCLYRFLRLTPAYLFVLGVNELVLKYSHNFSVFSPAMIDHLTCGSYWWRNALYINNLFPQSEFCMLWSWYIANDTQFYILAIMILPIAVRTKTHLKWAAGIVLTFLVTSWITTFVIAMQYNYIARVEEPFALFDQLYDKPWLRIGPYLIGMATGYLLFTVDGKVKLSPLVATCGWLVSGGLILSLVYGLGRQGLVVPLSAIYAAFGHTAWGVALAWITVACCWGYAGPINALLGFRGFLPLSRLTYCAYLIHPVIMVFVSFQMDGPLHLHNVMVLTIFLGNLVISFMLSFLISVAFEAPIVQLLKRVLMPSPKEDNRSTAH